MKNKMFAAVAAIATIYMNSAIGAEYTTTILSENTNHTFKIEGEHKEELVFSIEPGLLSGKNVTMCQLRVSPTPQPGIHRADQDVNVKLGTVKVGSWSAYSKTTRPYNTKLKKEVCNSNSIIKLTLGTDKKKKSEWEYYGGGIKTIKDRPRLIVTYDTEVAPKSGKSTEWKYRNPKSFFKSSLLKLNDDKTFLTSPILYNGSIYVIAKCTKDKGICLYQATGSQQPASEIKLVDKSDKGLEVVKGALANITGSGRMRVITNGAIHSCDISKLTSSDRLQCDSKKLDISFNQDEMPVMGSDGSLYFKKVTENDASIVAYNPSVREIWRSDIKAKKVSPITLSANGKNAYLLSEIQSDSGDMTVLLRIDTATGEAIVHEIFYYCKEKTGCKVGDKITPVLADLLQPVVVSRRHNKETIDYVFVSGNTSDTGLLQLIGFEKVRKISGYKLKKRLIWSRSGKVNVASVLSVKDENTLFAIQDDKLKLYRWFDEREDSRGALEDSKMKDFEQIINIDNTCKEDIKGMLLDGNDFIYFYNSQTLCVYRSDIKQMFSKSIDKPATSVQFMQDGTLIGYNENNIFDVSPSQDNDLDLTHLIDGTIYSAPKINVSANEGEEVKIKEGDEVIMKGNKIVFSNKFKWPKGSVLKVISVR